MPPRMAAFSSPERGRRRMCCRSFCGLPQWQSLPNRIRSAPKARTRETKVSSESICRSSGSASSRGVSEPREKDVSSRADVSASSSCTCSQLRQHELHRTDLPQRTARLFRRAAGTAGEADAKARSLSAEVSRKLTESRKEAVTLTLREIRCPYCDFLVEKVFSDVTGHKMVYCRKCKVEYPINLGYFRRMKNRQAARLLFSKKTRQKR